MLSLFKLLEDYTNSIYTYCNSRNKKCTDCIFHLENNTCLLEGKPYEWDMREIEKIMKETEFIWENLTEKR